MSRRTRKADPAQGTPRPAVSVCRGCCCGTPKIPDVDHAGQLAGRHSPVRSAPLRQG